jgi:hypothetical protein
MRETDTLIHKRSLADTKKETSDSGPRYGIGYSYPLSPRMMTLRSAFRRGAAMADDGVLVDDSIRLMCLITGFCVS